MRAKKIGFGLIMLVLAAMGFVHAAAEVSPKGMGLVVETPTTLSASTTSSRVDLLSRPSLRQDEVTGALIAGRLPESLLRDARSAFLRDPLEITNARVLVLGSTFADDADRFAAMRLAVALSRRDSISLLWLSQQFAAAQDVDGLLRNLDALLRTDRGARENAVASLVGVLAVPDGDALLGDLIRAEPEWEANFWNAFVRNPVALENGARFFRQSGLKFTRMEPYLRDVYVQGLIDSGNIGAMIEIIRLTPDLREGISDLANGEFSAGTGDNPLDWRTANSGNFVARVVPSSNVLEINASPGSFGVAASRIVEFDGAAELSIALAQPVADPAQLTLSAVCAEGEPRLLGAIVLQPGESAGRARIAPGDCDFGLLGLDFRVEQGRDGAIFEIAAIAMR